MVTKLGGGFMRKLVFLLALGATACGMQPATHPKPISLGTSAAAPAVPARPVASAAPAADPAHAFLARANAAFLALPAYHAKMSFFQTNGEKSGSGVYDLSGKQPRTLNLHVIEGDGQGTKILWTGGDTVKVRPAGLLSAITVDLQQDDERLKSVRGYTLKETDIPGLMGQMGDPANQLAGPTQTADGAVVRVTGPHLLKGVVAMTGTFDPVTMLPRKVEMTDGHQVVLRFVISNMRAQSSISLEI